MQAIVIRTHPSRESDLVVRVIAQGIGKVALYARRARTQRSNSLSGIDMFDWGEFELGSSLGSLKPISSFRWLGSFPRIRSDLNRFTIASAVCDAFDLLLVEDANEDEDYFELLRDSLKAIDSTTELKHLLRICFASLSELLSRTGFGQEPKVTGASAKNLLLVIDHIESCAERKMLSRDAVILVLDSLRSSSAA